MSTGLTARTLSRRVDDSTARLSARLQSRIAAATVDPEAGMSTAEYALGTVAACGFAGILVTLLKSGAVGELLHDMIFKTIRGIFKL